MVQSLIMYVHINNNTVKTCACVGAVNAQCCSYLGDFVTSFPILVLVQVQAVTKIGAGIYSDQINFVGKTVLCFVFLHICSFTMHTKRAIHI